MHLCLKVAYNFYLSLLRNSQQLKLQKISKKMDFCRDNCERSRQFHYANIVVLKEAKVMKKTIELLTVTASLTPRVTAR